MSKLLRDPLIHFLLIGAVLFVVLAAFSEDDDPQVIRVPEQIVAAALRTQLPLIDTGAGVGALSEQQRARIVDSLIRDEVYYREALALGLDVEDDQVRTRLIEKMRYLSEDMADPEPADEAQLRAFFDANPGRFAIAEAVTFDHVFFSPSQRGDAVVEHANAALEQLRAGADPTAVGDSTPLGAQFAEAEAARLQVLFGEEMTSGIFAAADGEWVGPFESDFGLHLIRVVGRRASAQPTYERAGEAVREAFAEEQRAQMNEAAWQAMRARYDIVIEWPEDVEAFN